MKRVDVTIIGGGPVGLFASFYAGLRGMTVRIIDSLPQLGGQLTALYPEKYVYDMPGFPEVLAKELAHGLEVQGTRFHPDLVLEETASGLEQDEEGWVITGATGERYLTRTIIISAGAGAFSPTKLGVENEEFYVGKGLAYGVKEKAAYKDLKVAVIGGGDSAFDWALNLNGIAKSVTIIHRRDQFRAHEESIKEAHERGVEFLLWKAVKSLEGTDKIERIVLENTQTKELNTHEFDAVIVNIGFKSTLGPIKDWGIEIEKNQVKVDHLYQTNLPGIYAVGDVCTYAGKIKLIATGVGEAATAVCLAKMRLDPSAKLFPGHSSEMSL